MKKNKTTIHDELRPEYDLRNLRVRKFGPARKQFGNFVKLEPDVAAVFPDAAYCERGTAMSDSSYPKKTTQFHLTQINGT